MNNKFLSLIILIIVAIGIPMLFKNNLYLEGYSNFSLEQATGNLTNNLLVQDSYPAIKTGQLSNNTSNDMWWHYPTFTLGSYKQITNNIKYPNNPDVGTCMPGSMCGALYKEAKLGDNYINPLPPVSPNCGTRVGYFTTNDQLVDGLPFRTELANILY